MICCEMIVEGIDISVLGGSLTPSSLIYGYMVKCHQYTQTEKQAFFTKKARSHVDCSHLPVLSSIHSGMGYCLFQQSFNRFPVLSAPSFDRLFTRMFIKDFPPIYYFTGSHYTATTSLGATTLFRPSFAPSHFALPKAQRHPPSPHTAHTHKVPCQ